MSSEFIFLKIMPRYNFGELFIFFSKGLVPLKIQTKFKSCLLPEFVIQILMEFEFVTKGKVVYFYLFCHSKTFGNFWTLKRVVFPYSKVAPGREIFKFETGLGQPTSQCAMRSYCASDATS
jgi:hypothetical protein